MPAAPLTLPPFSMMMWDLLTDLPPLPTHSLLRCCMHAAVVQAGGGGGQNLSQDPAPDRPQTVSQQLVTHLEGGVAQEVVRVLGLGMVGKDTAGVTPVPSVEAHASKEVQGNAGQLILPSLFHPGLRLPSPRLPTLSRAHPWRVNRSAACPASASGAGPAHTNQALRAQC